MEPYVVDVLKVVLYYTDRENWGNLLHHEQTFRESFSLYPFVTRNLRNTEEVEYGSSLKKSGRYKS